MKPIIEVENISKLYHLGLIGATTLHDSLDRWWYKMRGKEDELKKIGAKHLMIEPNDPQAGPEPNTIWALKDVSFSVKQGEIIGIIGKNGAGKSTLLKILTRITDPTSGRAIMRGRVASLLEVGTGFHPELTGRENIYLNGAILGMRKLEIDKKFDEIVDFSGVEKFIDTPVKRYSSGMYVRLAFAIAAHLEPEILLVDEVLAVGDVEFQKKCLGKMKDVAAGGRTVLFVSHNMIAIKSLCNRSILIDKGKTIIDGDTQNVVNRYLKNDATSSILEHIWKNIETAPGNDKVRVHKARLTIDGEGKDNIIRVDTPLKLEFEFWNIVSDIELNFSLHLQSMEGVSILSTPSRAIICTSGILRGVCHIPANFLNNVKYRIMLLIVKDEFSIIYQHDDILIFEVQDIERENSWYGKWTGLVRPDLKWEVNYLKNIKA